VTHIDGGDPCDHTIADTIADCRPIDTGGPGSRGVDDASGTAGAIFEASRDELLGSHTLLNSAEIARSYCTIADRVVSIVAITPGRIRRVDCWLGGVGFVTHAGANDTSQQVLGSVCDRDRAVELSGSVVDSLVGGIPETPASSAVDLDAVGVIRADAIPEAVEWIVVVSANRTDTGAPPRRLVAVGGHGGLAVQPLDSLDEPMSVVPASREQLERQLTTLIGPLPRSVVELLADD
jgi:hypothetical protein